LKLGRKKRHSFSASKRMERFNIKCYGMAAVPVAEAERREMKVQRRATAGQPVSNPARDTSDERGYE